MKKALSISLVSLLLITAAGTTIGMHFCGENLMDVAVFGHSGGCCEKSGMPMGCCHDESVTISSDDYQAPAPAISLPDSAPLLAILPAIVVTEGLPSWIPVAHRTDTGPPLSGADRRKQFRTLLI